MGKTLIAWRESAQACVGNVGDEHLASSSSRRWEVRGEHDDPIPNSPSQGISAFIQTAEEGVVLSVHGPWVGDPSRYATQSCKQVSITMRTGVVWHATLS
ncbi:hypothetical protein AMJ82_05700 [candidate division TA06 bacterium SM23_40]|uniref:Uncharacterized protein n=1 Tax=candidate division TA06 bacterium SM23_40 TaxID=1703774 RepID=A0A0S8G9I9_UNCT6|nr:MAG: hypothetical protein AMJ82_05700 [candidate division TA06 bacterium SM23_40]